MRKNDIIRDLLEQLSLERDSRERERIAHRAEVRDLYTRLSAVQVSPYFPNSVNTGSHTTLPNDDLLFDEEGFEAVPRPVPQETS